MAKSEFSSSPLSLSFGSSAKKKTLQSESTIETGNNTREKETRQETKSSAKELIPSDVYVYEQREEGGEDESLLSEDCRHIDTDIDQLYKELELQESVIKAKEQELMKWQLILETQRENIDKDIQKWQAVLADATKANQEKHEGGIKKWQKVLADATTMRNTKEMEQASERLKRLEELANVPTNAMMEAKTMIDQLEQQRDAPMKIDLTLPITKKEKKYVKDILNWQKALAAAAAAAKHKKDCNKRKEAFLDSQHSKAMKQVRFMIPTEHKEQAMEKLEELEQQFEKDARMIVMRHAVRTVYQLEKELLRFKGDLNTTKKLIRQAEAVESMDDFSDEGGISSTCSYDCLGFSWLCGTN